MSQWLHENSWSEAKVLIEKSRGVALIPVGSVEQHGYHLPLGTDSFNAIGLAGDGAERAKVVAAPPLWYGWAPHHMVLPGTVTIRPQVLIDLLYDVIKSLAHHGLTKFVVINGHRIVNIPWIQIAAEAAQRELGVTVKIFDPDYMGKSILAELGFGKTAHADEIETSHMLHLYPDLVHMELASDNPTETEELYGVTSAYTGDTLCYVPSTEAQMAERAQKFGGVSGEPTKADREKGRIFHEFLMGHLIRVIEMLQNGN